MAKFSDRTNTLLDILSDRPIAYHPALAKIVGGAKAAIWVSQMLYWDGKGKKRGGWIYKTQYEWQEETGLTRTEQETVRRKLVSKGFMEEKKCGIPCTLHYRLDYDALMDCATRESQQTSLQDSCKLKDEISNQDCGNSTNLTVETPQSIPENTQEITTEITTEEPRDFLDDLFTHSQKQTNKRPSGWSHVALPAWEICQLVDDLFPCKLPVVKSSHNGHTQEMIRGTIDKWIYGATFLLEAFNGDVRATRDAITSFVAEYDGGFTVAGPQSLTNVVTSFVARKSKPKKRRGGRRVGVWTEEELEAARRESLAEPVLDPKTFFDE